MVVFTCNNCGETLQKPRVAKHYQFQCRTTPNLTCVDCLKDFPGQEYIQHTKCVTEAERYGGKNYVPKPGVGKGEKKQQQWLNLVNGLLDTATNLSNAERNFLQCLTKYENIPRKKAKFQNFINNALPNKVSKAVVESVWARIEAAQQNNSGNIKEPQNNNINGHNKLENSNIECSTEENNIVENENNENICKENNSEQKSDINSSELEFPKKSKKSKKRSSAAMKDLENLTPTKKNKVETEDTSISNDTNSSENVSEKVLFDWKSEIINKTSSKGEISLKKLRKHVFMQYKACYPDAELDEKFLKKFNKKLNKIPEITVSEEKARLIK